MLTPTQLESIENKIREKYNWDDQQYDGWDCSNKSVECEKYFETELGYSCYFVYGDRDRGTDDWAAHMWNFVEIDGAFYEFESTALQFRKVSDKYNILDMQEGFYVNGVEFETSQPLENWENLI